MTWAAEEFGTADLGDKQLNNRLVKLIPLHTTHGTVRVHRVQRRRLMPLQADGDGCAPRKLERPSAGRDSRQRPRKQARRRGVGEGREDGRVHEFPQVYALAQAGLMNAEATRQELIAAQ